MPARFRVWCAARMGLRWSRRESHISRRPLETRGLVRTGKDGAYITEVLPPGPYQVHVDGRDFLPADATINVTASAAAKLDFKLDWIILARSTA